MRSSIFQSTVTPVLARNASMPPSSRPGIARSSTNTGAAITNCPSSAAASSACCASRFSESSRIPKTDQYIESIAVTIHHGHLEPSAIQPFSRNRYGSSDAANSSNTLPAPLRRNDNLISLLPEHNTVSAATPNSLRNSRGTVICPCWSSSLRVPYRRSLLLLFYSLLSSNQPELLLATCCTCYIQR